MKIYNLTGNSRYDVKGQFLTDVDNKIIDGFNRLVYPTATFLHNRFGNLDYEKNLKDLLNEVPVYLVTKAQSNKSICCNETDETIDVPDDVKNVASGESFKPEIWERNMNNKYDRQRNQNDFQSEPRPTRLSIWGLYRNDEIFIWVDKIKDICGIDSFFFNALAENVVIHEWTHALMDVRRYGLEENVAWQSHDIVYHTREESLANGFALFAGLHLYGKGIQGRILGAIEKQPASYQLGKEYYEDTNLLSRHIHSWMRQKVDVLSRDEIHQLAQWMKAVIGYPKIVNKIDFSTDFDGADSDKVAFPVVSPTNLTYIKLCMAGAYLFNRITLTDLERIYLDIDTNGWASSSVLGNYGINTARSRGDGGRYRGVLSITISKQPANLQPILTELYNRGMIPAGYTVRP